MRSVVAKDTIRRHSTRFFRGVDSLALEVIIERTAQRGFGDQSGVDFD